MNKKINLVFYPHLVGAISCNFQLMPYITDALIEVVK